MHVFVDLDGTLTDPRDGFVNCVRHALSSLQIDIAEGFELESCIGPPLHQTFAELCADDELTAAAIGIYRARYASVGLFENRLYDGILQCLSQMAPVAASIHVVTSKPTVYSQRIVEHFGLKPYLDAVYGSNLDGSLADKTELLAHVLDNEGIDAAQAVMIGDRKFDIVGARNHGIRSIGVLWGYGSEQELRTAGADRVCDHPAQIPAAVFG